MIIIHRLRGLIHLKSSSKEIQGKISDQLTLKLIKEHTKIFTGHGVNIGITDTGLNLPAGQHVHTNYEFLFPISSSIISTAEKRKLYIEKNNFSPINTDQFHGPENDMIDFRFLCIEIEKQYLHVISHALFGKSEIFFENEYLIDIKINKAKEMLIQQKENIIDICFFAGLMIPVILQMYSEKRLELRRLNSESLCLFNVTGVKGTDRIEIYKDHIAVVPVLVRLSEKCCTMNIF